MSVAPTPQQIAETNRLALEAIAECKQIILTAAGKHFASRYGMILSILPRLTAELLSEGEREFKPDDGDLFGFGVACYVQALVDHGEIGIVRVNAYIAEQMLGE